MFADSIYRNSTNLVVGHEKEVVLTCEIPFAFAFKKLSGKKNFSEYVQKQKYFVEPKQKINVGFNP